MSKCAVEHETVYTVRISGHNTFMPSQHSWHHLRNSDKGTFMAPASRGLVCLTKAVDLTGTGAI